MDGTNYVSLASNFDSSGHTLTVATGGEPLFGRVYSLIQPMKGVGLTSKAVSVSGIAILSGTSIQKAPSSAMKWIRMRTASPPPSRYDASISDCTIESGVTIGYGKDQSFMR